MKKIVLLLLLPFVLLGSNMQYELKIYSTLLDNFFVNKQTIKVWTDDAQKAKMLSALLDVQIVKNMDNADIFIVQKEKNIPNDKLIFATNYLILKYYKKEAIGGFYWKKGRPNILLLRENLSKHHLRLSASFDDFIEDGL